MTNLHTGKVEGMLTDELYAALAALGAGKEAPKQVVFPDGTVSRESTGLPPGIVFGLQQGIDDAEKEAGG